MSISEKKSSLFLEDLEENYFFSSLVYEKCLECEAEELWQEVHKELRNLVRPVESNQKSHYRDYTWYARLVALEKHKDWLHKNWSKYSHFFAAPIEVNASKIKPRLELVERQSQRNIFRIARLFWSLPYSRGYGRRLEYLIWDDENGKLIGILGLQSPPLSLPVRDKYYQIPSERKINLVNRTMDAYTLGALPPYNELLGGKLIVLAAASREIRKDYERRYKGRSTVMLKQVLPASLVAVTTLSAFGRSSIYNRVSKGKNGQQNLWAALSLGHCEGWGTLHFSDALYAKMKIFHKQLLPDKPVINFGTGPRIRLQVTKYVLSCLGLPGTLLRHNIKREVFVIPHVANLEAILGGSRTKPIYNDQPFGQLAAFWKERYCLPRAETRCSIDGKQTIANALQLETETL